MFSGFRDYVFECVQFKHPRGRCRARQHQVRAGISRRGPDRLEAHDQRDLSRAFNFDLSDRFSFSHNHALLFVWLASWLAASDSLPLDLAPAI
jgi:hypothetical protein